MSLNRPLVAASLLGAALALLAAPAVGGQEDPSDRVLVATVDGTITPVMADYVDEAVGRAEDGGYEALLIRIDTPGGLDTSMRDISQDLLNAQVPTVVWVAPSGARAASAGAIITLASHVAAMAPGTAIGAATPVSAEGGDLGEKAKNDAVAYAESLARARGRDVEFARNAVLEAESVPDEEALERGVVEFLSDDLRDLLEQIDGVEVELQGGGRVTLETAGASVDELDLGFFRSVQQWLADPNLAFLFISIGTLAILYEVANPGVGAGGILGAILLILAFFSLSVLPVNAVGALLLVLAVALFVGEMFVPGVGVMAAGGAVSLVLGGLFLFRGSSGVDPVVLWPTAVVVGGGAFVITRFAWRTRHAPRASGTEAMLGRTATVRSARGRAAQVFLEGAYWQVRRADGGEPAVGDEVRVVERDGLVLVVEPVDDVGESEQVAGERESEPVGEGDTGRPGDDPDDG